MTNDEIIADLIEWELSEYNYEGLKEYFFNTKKETYKNWPQDLEDMLEYRKQYEDTEIVLDEEARELARQQDNE